MAFVDPGSAPSDRSGRGRGVDRRRAAGGVRGDRRCSLPARRRVRRATSCSVSRSRPPAACGGRIGRIPAATLDHALHELRRRRRRDQRLPLETVRASRRAAVPRGGAGGHALAGRAGRRRVMPRVVLLVAVDRRSVLAPRLQRRRHGPGGHRPHAGCVRRPDRRPHLPRLRACRRRAASGAHRGWNAPAAARLAERGARHRIPFGLIRGGVHVPRALRTRSRSRRSRDRARAAALGERPGRRGRLGRAVLADQPGQRGDAGRIRAGGRGHRVGQPTGV